MVGILIPVIGLVVTVLTQQRSGTPQAGAPVGHTSAPAPAPPATTPTTPRASAAQDADTASPSSPSSAAPAVLGSGNFALEPGHSADLEHGTAGKAVKSPDISWSGDDDFAALNGRVARSLEGATLTHCVDLIRDYSTGSASMAPAGTWFCMPTSAGHVAGLEYLGPIEGGRRQFHYIVWDALAPTS
ncbi:hypothetical protein V2W30_38785 [Streptomyces sp. Q6]|uniref:Uncharacterized protein n=1 Tax=Streptomyces citrinus TaxID=3118173 RepID=A0ACD5AN37_9ACTN